MVETRRISTSAKRAASPRSRSAKRSKRSSPELTTPAVESKELPQPQAPTLTTPPPAAAAVDPTATQDDRAEGCPAQEQLAKMMGTMDFQRKQLARTKSKGVWGKLLSQYSEAIDHIINSAAKSNYLSAGQINVPIVFRGTNGATAGVGAQHSQVEEAGYRATHLHQAISVTDAKFLHCPTNGDPNFDIRRAKPPTDIPRSMLMATPDGSYALPSGVAAVLKPNDIELLLRRKLRDFLPADLLVIFH